MRFFLLPALLLTACSGSAVAQPPPATGERFDAHAWMTRAAAVWDTTVWNADYEGTRALSRRYANELDDALGVVRACELDQEARTSEDVAWGGMSRETLGPDEYLVRVGCEHASYNPSFVYVHVNGDRAAVLQVPVFSGAAVVGLTPTLLGYDTLDLGHRRFSLFTRGTGMGDCGSYDTFEFQGVGEPATLIEARYLACGGEAPTEGIPDPREYPVVYPTR